MTPRLESCIGLRNVGGGDSRRQSRFAERDVGGVEWHGSGEFEAIGKPSPLWADYNSAVDLTFRQLVSAHYSGTGSPGVPDESTRRSSRVEHDRLVPFSMQLVSRR